jgi:hypothetical protein
MRPLLPRGHRATALVIVGLALAAGSTACSGGAHSTADSSGARQGAPQDGAAGNAAGDAGQGAGPAAPAQGGKAQAGGGNAQAVPGAAAGKPGQPDQGAAAGRSIVYTGSITLRVPDVDRAATAVEGLAAEAGGFVGGDDRNIDSQRSTATVVLRIPAGKFGGILDEISKSLPGGREQSRKVSTEDVTETVIDLDSRIQSQQASVDRVRALLARAQSLTDITSIESQLAQREAALESMQAQKRSLDDLTTLSTVTVNLLGPEAAVSTPPKHETGFWGGLKGGWHAFTGTLRVVLVILGAVLPFAVVVGVPTLLVLWLRRRRRLGRPPQPAVPPQPAAPAEPAAPAVSAEPAEPAPGLPPLPRAPQAPDTPRR